MSGAGKGSRRRPTNEEKYRKEHDRIFTPVPKCVYCKKPLPDLPPGVSQRPVPPEGSYTTWGSPICKECSE